MRDWSGTRIQADALSVPCRDCKAVKGSPCVRDDGQPLRNFPAHCRRITDAQQQEKQ